MPRHGRRGKEKSSHGWRVSTVSSGIENPGHNSYRHSTAKRSPHDSTACLHHRLMPRIIETIGKRKVLAPKSKRILQWYEAKELIDKHDIDVAKSLFIGNDSTTDIKGVKEYRMDAFYVKSNISPKDDMAHDADYVIDNFTNW